MEHTFYIERWVGPGDMDHEELTFAVGIDGYTPYNPGRTSGPPERCYPPEGGYAEIGSVDLVKEDGTREGFELSVFLELYAADKGLEDEDPAKVLHPRSVLTQAEAEVCADLYEAAVEDCQAAYEYAAEARADEMRDEGY